MPIKHVYSGRPYSVLSERPRYSRYVWDAMKAITPQNKFDKMRPGLESFERAFITPTDIKRKVLDGFGRDYPAYPKHDEILVQSIALAKRQFRLHKKPTYKKLSHFELKDIPSNTSPGLVFKNMGFKTKAEAFPIARLCAERTKHFVGKGIANPSYRPVWNLGSRSHLVTRGKEKIRVIWVCPLDHLLLEGSFALPLIQAYRAEGSSPIAWDLGVFSGNYRRIAVNFRDNEDTAVNLDYSSFDESIPPWLINIAFDILKDNIDFGFKPKKQEKWKKIYEYVRSCFIKTKFQTSDGEIYEKNGGIPSGSWFTQLVGSICNAIITNYCSLKTYGCLPKVYKFLGDDAYLQYNNDQCVHFSSDLFSEACEIFQVKLNADKIVVSKKIEQVPFLGHYFRRNGPPWRPASQLLTLLLYPETPDGSWLDAAQRALGIMYDAMSWYYYVWHLCSVLISAGRKEIGRKLGLSATCYEHKLEWKRAAERFYIYNLQTDVPRYLIAPDHDELFLKGWLGTV